jgi:hypothetical protein
MVWIFVGFGVAFVLGAILAVVGGAGVELTNCPSIFSGLPAQDPSCKSFSLLVFLGGIMTIIGGAVASAILTFGKLPSQRQ